MHLFDVQARPILSDPRGLGAISRAVAGGQDTHSRVTLGHRVIILLNLKIKFVSILRF